ncbi:hypothetical protein E0Z10_g7861 [Xylaria hypoxylon]|uniref:Uncharacterized protein n=1 Tax=Xylaria hypoxylon TaxID=37992 RepID=A0A4Z0YCT6_9PEZI|nr:hypothetical protein E0Z10_g7861 [Xylaria hypoxylon]
MRFLPVILIALLVSLAAATPVQIVNPASAALTKRWTVDEVVRQRFNRDKTCKWHMIIHPLVASINGTTNSAADEPVRCEFLVQVPSGDDCGIKEFGPIQCSRDNHGFYVNAGHNENGFIVMVVENVDENTQAYFGFLDSALDSGATIPPQTSPVKNIGYKTNVSLLARQDGSGNGSAPVWTIGTLTRRINTDKNILHISFVIRTGDEDLEPFHCNLRLNAPVDTNLAKWEWYDKKCDDSGFYVSWGYMEASDAGIMTLVNPARNSMAFFGFENISNSEALESTGGGTVEPCDCGEKTN